MTTVDNLWGSYVTDVSVDPTSRRVTVTVTLDERPTQRTASLVLDGVSALQMNRPSEGWESVELTEVHISDSQPLQVELVFWSEPDGLTATCLSASVAVP